MSAGTLSLCTLMCLTCSAKGTFVLPVGENVEADGEDTPRRGYVLDILEESGPALMKRCYWDFGRWSDMWRTWRPIGADRPFRETPVTLGVRSWAGVW